MTEPIRVLWKGQFQVPFYWADPAGLMFFGNIYLAAQCQWELWAKATPDAWSLWFNSQERAYPLRHSSAEHLRPMRFGEIFDVWIKVQTCTESTFVLWTEFSKESGTHAVVQTVHTAIDKAQLKKSIMDPRFSELLTASQGANQI